MGSVSIDKIKNYDGSSLGVARWFGFGFGFGLGGGTTCLLLAACAFWLLLSNARCRALRRGACAESR